MRSSYIAYIYSPTQVSRIYIKWHFPHAAKLPTRNLHHHQSLAMSYTFTHDQFPIEWGILIATCPEFYTLKTLEVVLKPTEDNIIFIVGGGTKEGWQFHQAAKLCIPDAEKCWEDRKHFWEPLLDYFALEFCRYHKEVLGSPEAKLKYDPSSITLDKDNYEEITLIISGEVYH